AGAGMDHRTAEHPLHFADAGPGGAVAHGGGFGAFLYRAGAFDSFQEACFRGAEEISAGAGEPDAGMGGEIADHVPSTAVDGSGDGEPQLLMCGARPAAAIGAVGLPRLGCRGTRPFLSFKTFIQVTHMGTPVRRLSRSAMVALCALALVASCSKSPTQQPTVGAV